MASVRDRSLPAAPCSVHALAGSDLAAALAEAERLCVRRGVRLTAQRRVVLSLVLEAGRPVSAYQLLESMQANGVKPAPPTVYRALDFLLAQGLVHKLESLHAFVGCPHPGEAHDGQFLICEDCGQVSELCSAPLSAGLRSALQDSGFRAQREVVEVLGRCSLCSGADARSSRGAGGDD